MRDWMACILDVSGRVNPPPPFWSPPQCGLFKVNFDGASFRNPGPAGYGCLMHNHNGVVLMVKSGPLGHCDTIEAGLIELLHSLHLLKVKGVQKCIVEGDSKTVISWGQRRVRGFVEAAALHSRDQSFGHSFRDYHSTCSKIYELSC